MTRAGVGAVLGAYTGHVVVGPPGALQRIRNVGACDLVFLAVCTPRFTRDAYETIDPEPMCRWTQEPGSEIYAAIPSTTRCFTSVRWLACSKVIAQICPPASR
jgi:hypothetical protein